VRHPFFQASRPQLFAHRGGSGLAPENTLHAFDAAIALGVDGLEIDVRLSRDGVVVVHHDRTLARTTNVSAAVDSLTADELARIDAAYHFRPAPTVHQDVLAGRPPERPLAGCGIGVPTLAEVLTRYRDVRVIIELKLDTAALAHAVVDVVRRAGADERVCLGSFGRRVLRDVRRLAPHIATSAARDEVRWALYRSWVRWPVRQVAYDGYQVPETAGATRVVSPAFVEQAHAAGLGVQVWTVDVPADGRRLLAWGVDALISDRPDLLQPIVAARRAGR
jgi:glycerophosphoryl diester phosphodiesterase